MERRGCEWSSNYPETHSSRVCVKRRGSSQLSRGLQIFSFGIWQGPSHKCGNCVHVHIRERLDIYLQGVRVYVRRTSGIRMHLEDSRAWADF